MSEVEPTGGPTVQTVTVQNPTTMGGVKKPAGAPSLGEFGKTEEDDSDAEGAKERENLTALLGLLGFPDLPTTRTDLMNQSNRLMQLQGKIGEVIKQLQESGSKAGVPGTGVAGPPDPENAVKIETLNDLQLQLQQGAEQFQNYAYAYFSGTEKALPLSQAQILRAYGEKAINRDDAIGRLATAGMNATDIGIVLHLEEKEQVEKAAAEAEKAQKKREDDAKPNLSAGTIAEAYSKGRIDRSAASAYLGRIGLTAGEISLVLDLEDIDKASKAATERAKGGGGSGGKSGTPEASASLLAKAKARLAAQRGN